MCLVLGDNIFFGHNLVDFLKKAVALREGAIILGYYVKDPERYGVIEFDEDGNALSIEEKPQNPRSNYAVCGLYFYDNNVIDIAKGIKPSSRGELEITSVNNEYIRREKLRVELLGRGYAWLDTGTYDSLMDASLFIKTIGCIEEVAYRMGYIDAEQLEKLAERIDTNYGRYLMNILKEKERRE